MASIIDIYGRRVLLLLGAVGMCIFMLLAAYLAGVLEPDNPNRPEDPTTYGNVLFFSLCAYMASFALGWGGVPWVYPSEIFPMDVKEKCLSVSVFFQWLANFVIAVGIGMQLNLWGTALTFTFYGVCLVFAVFYVFFQIPETKGVKMEDMDALFGSSEEASKIVYDNANSSSFACSVDAKPRRASQSAAGGESFSEMTPGNARRGSNSSASNTPKQRTSSRLVKGPGASFTLA